MTPSPCECDKARNRQPETKQKDKPMLEIQLALWLNGERGILWMHRASTAKTEGSETGAPW